jgi:hypothetical protein
MVLVCSILSAVVCYGEISGSHGSKYEHDCLLKRCTMLSGKKERSFRGPYYHHHHGGQFPIVTVKIITIEKQNYI